MIPTLDHTISRPIDSAALRVLSLGGGLQSCALALMSARGDLPMLDAAIFADTGDEKRETYRYLDWLEPRLPFQLIRARRPGRSLAEHAIANATAPLEKTIGRPPFFLSNPKGMAPKHCNADFKRDVVTRAIRALMLERGIRLTRGAPVVEQWIGFTRDELERLADHRKKYIGCRWPLIEMRMTRPDCRRWFEERQLRVPPKSSCVYCPYQGDAQWRSMKENPADDDWSRAVAFDAAIRPYYLGATGAAYVHRSCAPLDEVSFNENQGDLFREDCDGSCGS